MAKYTSRFKELSFYVGDEIRRFSSGTYETDVKAEQEVLSRLDDVVSVNEPKIEEPKAEEKPAPKAPARKKTSAK